MATSSQAEGLSHSAGRRLYAGGWWGAGVLPLDTWKLGFKSACLTLLRGSLQGLAYLPTTLMPTPQFLSAETASSWCQGYHPSSSSPCWVEGPAQDHRPDVSRLVFWLPIHPSIGMFRLGPQSWDTWGSPQGSAGPGPGRGIIITQLLSSLSNWGNNILRRSAAGTGNLCPLGIYHVPGTELVLFHTSHPILTKTLS